jgi:integrase
LKAVREKLVQDGLARTNVNRFVRIIVMMFGYAVENELVPGAVWQALKAVRPLQKNRSEARETDPIGPVDDATVEATLAHLAEPYATMVRLQLLLGCRPGELVAVSLDQIDRTKEVWLYRPRTHKTEHKDKSRLIPIGPRAQILLLPHLPAFEPMPILRTRHGKPVSVSYFHGVIAKACDQAGIDRWHPNQLRHAAATKIREQASLDASQVILGHSSIQTTQVYASKNERAAIEIAAKIG